jgi:hypothetical protein
MDRDTVRVLVVLNGGGAVALLALLPNMFKVPEFLPITKAVMVAVIIQIVGLVLTVFHNMCRRECSRINQELGYTKEADMSSACQWSRQLRIGAIFCFAVSGLTVAFTGWNVINHV